MNNLKPANNNYDTKRIHYAFTSEAEWLEMRKAYYTSTVTPGLFGLSPYVTPFEIYHAKAEGKIMPVEQTERMAKGKRLEAAIAQEVGIELRMEVRPLNDFIVIEGTKLAASFDYEILHPEHGWIPLEIKCVDPFIYKKQWIDDEAPDHIELQVQHQMHVRDAHHCVLAASTSIYDLHIHMRHYDEEVGASIERAVLDMETRIAFKNAPRPDFTRDLDVIKFLHPNGAGDADFTGKLDVDALAAKYDRLKEEEKETKKLIEATQAQLFFLLKDREKGYTDNYKISAPTVAASLGTFITPEMVGTNIGGRKSYRRLSISKLD